MPNNEEVIDATQTAHGYLVSQLSEHISETPEGFLIVVGCPIARTGFQEYAVRDLPQESAEDLGIDIGNPSALIDLYRPASEVFAPEFLASLNGKPIADNHPPGFITPNNFAEYACGHIQNVRKGDEQLDSGEWPVIADLVISRAPLIDKVRNKTSRDVSLGYDFSIARDGKKIIQCNMVGNHAAIVPKGRAGLEVAIGDSAPGPASSPPISSIAPPAVERAATSKTSTAVQPSKKENKPVANVLKHLLGLGLKAYATDAEPEALAEAAEAIKQSPPPAEDKKARDRKARDNELMEEDDHDEEVADAKRKARDRKLRDAELDEEDEPVMDGKRKAMHDALDDLIDQEEAGDKHRAKDRKVNDADLEELKSLLGQFFSEEEKEPAHASDEDLEEEDEPVVDAAPLDEVLGNEEPEAEDAKDEDPEELEEEEGAEDDDLEEGEEDLEPVGDKRHAKDRARAADGAAAVLKMLRPVVARCKDSKVQDAFNSALSSVTRSSRASNGGYGSFAGAARARDSKLPRAPLNRAHAADSGAAGADKRIADIQAAYDAAHNAHKGGK
jgi:hypothetical protein